MPGEPEETRVLPVKEEKISLTIASPLNEIELRNLLFTAQHHPDGPIVIRYPRGRGVNTDWKLEFKEIEKGTGQRLRDGDDLAVISLGPLGNTVAEAIDDLENDNLSIAHYDLRFLKPIDRKLLKQVFSKHKKIITVEDGSVAGGMGSAILEYMSENKISAEVKRLGVPDKFIDHGTVEELYRECGLDKSGILEAIRSMISSKIYFKAI